MIPLTGAQVDALAAYMTASRPGWIGWDLANCRQAIIDAGTITRDPEAMTRAVAAIASNPAIKRPAVLAMPGEHWENVGRIYIAAERRDPHCPHCHSVACNGALDDDDQPLCAKPPVPPEIASNLATEARKEIRAAKTRRQIQHAKTKPKTEAPT